MLLVAYLANTKWCKKPEKMKRMIFYVLNPYAVGGWFGQYNTKWCKKTTEKMTETLAHGYSSECSARTIQLIPAWQGLDGSQNIWEYSAMVFKNLCILVLWTKVASALEGFELCKSKSYSTGGVETVCDLQVNWYLRCISYLHLKWSFSNPLSFELSITEEFDCSQISSGNRLLWKLGTLEIGFSGNWVLWELGTLGIGYSGNWVLSSSSYLLDKYRVKKLPFPDCSFRFWCGKSDALKMKMKGIYQMSLYLGN